jgi:hypothetical protein
MCGKSEICVFLSSLADRAHTVTCWTRADVVLRSFALQFEKRSLSGGTCWYEVHNGFGSVPSKMGYHSSR